MWMVALLLGALAAERRSRARLAGALWACSAAIKWIPLLFLPLRLAERRKRRLSWPAFVGTAALLAAGATLLFGPTWFHAATPLLHNASVGTRTGLPHLLRAVGLAPTLTEVLILTGLAATYGALCLSARRGRARLGLAAGLFLCATPWLLPWYAVWALPLAVAEDETAAITLATALSGYLLIAYRL